MRTENYEEISMKVTKKWKDESGKTRQRTRKFYQTLSPFNLKDGRPKTREEIKKELITEYKQWLDKKD